MSITAMKQALEALKYIGYVPREDGSHPIEKAITALRTAIAEAEACEPSAWLCCVPGQNPCLLFDEPSDERYPPGYKDPLFLAAGAQDAQQGPEGPLVEGWQLTMSDGHAGFGVYAHMTEYPDEGAIFLLAAGAQPYSDSTAELSVGDSSFESWYASYVKEGTKGLKHHCRDAYAAGMGDPLVTYAQTAPKQEPFCYLYYERGEEMFAPPDGYRPDDAQPLYLAPQPAPKQEPSYRSVPHGHCTHPKCKEVFQEYLVLSEKIAKYEPEGKSPMILNAVPKQEPDTAYDEAKRLAEWLFKTHYASEECYASGRIVWEVCDTTDGVISQIDNMVYPLVMPAPKQGWKLLKDSTLDERSWPEDYKHENGNYQNSCCECGRMFNGYKRRVMCKVCSETPAAPVQTDHIAIPGKMVQPLTFDQIEDIWTKHGLNECDCHGFARAIEQAHGIKEQP